MITFTANGKDYQLKLTTRAALDLEEKLGTNPLNIFANASMDKVPPLKDLLVVLHFALQKFNHGISFNDTLDLYDNYIEEGHNIWDFYLLIIDIFKDSGILGDVDLEDIDPNLLKRVNRSQ